MPRQTYRKLITTSELIVQINIENSKLATAFLKEKSTRSSPMTINSYRCDLNLFFVWNLLNNENKLFTDIRKLELASFFSFAVDELKWGSSRLNRLRSTLSSFSIFIEKFMDDSYPNFSNIVLKTIESTPKNPRREKTILSNEQVESALAYFKEKDSQIACWLALGAFSGSRFSELLRFDTSLIDYNHVAFGDLFLETTRQVRSKGRGRDGKSLYKYILRERFWQYYSKWIENRKLILENKKQSHDMLFIKLDGSPANDGTAHSWITQIEKFLGVPFYCHSLRHFIVTEFSRKNIPPQLIQALVGWESLSMVTLYCDLEAKNQKWAELENLR